MFGFGLSSIDKDIIQAADETINRIGLSGRINSKDTLVYVKKILKNQLGDKIYTTSMGDTWISTNEYMKPRLIAGLSNDDVRNYWNRCALWVMMELKILEISIVIRVSDAESSGMLRADAVRRFRKIAPNYGDPSNWDRSHPNNISLSDEDGPIYVEFMPRVDAWRSKVSENELESLCDSHSSFNALVRSLIKSGAL